MRRRVNKPGAVQPDNDPKKHAPQGPGPSPDRVQSETEDHQRYPMPSRQHAIESIIHQVGRVLPHHLRIRVKLFTEDRPQEVGPPLTVTWRMGITRLIRVLMMNPV